MMLDMAAEIEAAARKAMEQPDAGRRRRKGRRS